MTAATAEARAETGALAAALAYLARGWSVVPIRPGAKRPCLDTWTEYGRHRPTEAEVRGWWRSCADGGVGIVTGAASGLLVLNADASNGGLASLADLEQQHGALTSLAVATGGGGRHCYLRLPPNG